MASPAVPAVRDLPFLWAAVLGWLELSVKPHQFKTWLKPTRPLSCDGKTLVVEAPTAFGCDWLAQQLLAVIHDALAEAGAPNLAVRFEPRRSGAVDSALEGDVSAERPAQRAPAPATLLGTLNHEFTLESYVLGEGNRLAVHACLSVVDEGERYISPLVIYGSPGMGKTHLLHALAAKARGLGWSIACFRAEEFTSHYMNALRAQALPEFQASVRAVRLFILDDLQYLDGKKGTQDELVHTMDAVTHHGGYVAFGSERPPLDLGFADRLATRLAAGTSVNVQPFRYAERSAYARQLANQRRSELSEWAIERIACIEAPSIRVVQGAINAAISLQRAGLLDLSRLDAELLKLSLQSVAPAAISNRALAEAIAGYFETTFDELVGRSRKPAVTAARAAAVAALKEHGRGNAEIATLLGARDRSTISQLTARGKAMLETDPRLRRIAQAG